MEMATAPAANFSENWWIRMIMSDDVNEINDGRRYHGPGHPASLRECRDVFELNPERIVQWITTKSRLATPRFAKPKETLKLWWEMCSNSNALKSFVLNVQIGEMILAKFTNAERLTTLCHFDMVSLTSSFFRMTILLEPQNKDLVAKTNLFTMHKAKISETNNERPQTPIDDDLTMINPMEHAMDQLRRCYVSKEFCSSDSYQNWVTSVFCGIVDAAPLETFFLRPMYQDWLCDDETNHELLKTAIAEKRRDQQTLYTLFSGICGSTCQVPEIPRLVSLYFGFSSFVLSKVI